MIRPSPYGMGMSQWVTTLGPEHEVRWPVTKSVHVMSDSPDDVVRHVVIEALTAGVDTYLIGGFGPEFDLLDANLAPGHHVEPAAGAQLLRRAASTRHGSPVLVVVADARGLEGVEEYTSAPRALDMRLLTVVDLPVGDVIELGPDQGYDGEDELYAEALETSPASIRVAARRR